MFIWVVIIGQNGKAVGTDLRKNKKEDLGLKERLALLPRVAGEHDKGKPGLGRVYCRIIIYLYR